MNPKITHTENKISQLEAVLERKAELLAMATDLGNEDLITRIKAETEAVQGDLKEEMEYLDELKVVYNV